MNLVTALVPSEIACLASSPGNNNSLNASLTHSLNATTQALKEPKIHKPMTHNIEQGENSIVYGQWALILAWFTFISMLIISFVGIVDFVVGCVDPKDHRCDS